MPIWDDEMFVLNSPGKLSMPGYQLEQSGGAACGVDGKEGYLQRQRKKSRESWECEGRRRRATQWYVQVVCSPWECTFQKASLTRSLGLRRSHGRQAVRQSTDIQSLTETKERQEKPCIAGLPLSRWLRAHRTRITYSVHSSN